MKQKMIAILVAFVMAISLAACGAGEETTLTGMVVSVDGSVISLMEMDTSNMGNQDFAESERPQMPEGMELPEGFEPGQMPGGFGGGQMSGGFGGRGEQSGEPSTSFYMNDKVNAFSGVRAA